MLSAEMARTEAKKGTSSARRAARTRKAPPRTRTPRAPENGASSGKLAVQVAAQIEAEIMRRGWPVGEVLGSERDLIEQFGVSRAVFREAVRIVESHHVARMRRGPNGGLIVGAPEASSVQAAAALYLDYADVQPEHLFTVRAALELTCVRQLVDELDEDKIGQLRAALASERELFEEGLPEGGHSQDLHILIAELTGNPALWLFVEVLTRLTRRRTVGAVNEQDRAVREIQRAHRAIVDAIIEGDAALAQHRMSRHLRAVASYAR
jgi:DNA-binding FadR family transcriptional regulator